MRVLSIDWDYFSGSKATPPADDSHTSRVLDFIWADWYDNGGTRYPLFGDPRIVYHLARLARRVSVRLNHHEVMSYLDGQDVSEVINVDFHHDCFSLGRNELTDCGNWMTKTHEDNDGVRLFWAGREESNREDVTVAVSDIAIEDIRGTFDLCFICKSEPWSPPHLDRDFIHLVNSLPKGTSVDSLCVRDRAGAVRKMTGWMKRG